MRSLYYRYCWHRVSNLLFARYRHWSLLASLERPADFRRLDAEFRRQKLFSSVRVFPRSVRVFPRVVSNRVRNDHSSLTKAVYDPRAFFLHAASLHQTFVHCGIFSTAATRRCLDSVSVPMLGVTLSRPLPVIALVVHYTTN